MVTLEGKEPGPNRRRLSHLMPSPVVHEVFNDATDVYLPRDREIEWGEERVR